MKDVINIVIITDNQHGIIQQQVDTLWYDWEDAAKRVHYLNGLYQNNHEYCDLWAHYHQEVVK